MRTTLTLADDVAAGLQKLVDRSGRSFKDVVNETLRAGLEAGVTAPARRRYRLQASHLGAVRRGVRMDKALQLAGSLEDDELIRKLELRK
jgi:hypothetical protein